MPLRAQWETRDTRSDSTHWGPLSVLQTDQCAQHLPGKELNASITTTILGRGEDRDRGKHKEWWEDQQQILEFLLPRPKIAVLLQSPSH